MKTLTAILSLTLSFFLSSTGIANAQETTSVSISQGQVTVTPARCHPDFCEIQIAKLEGTLAAQINDTEILFSNVNIRTSPDINFILPENPNTDIGDSIYSAKFSFNGTVLSVKGYIDSRAFDGPLIEYAFEAMNDSVIVDEDFIQREYFTIRRDYRKCISPLCGGFFVKQVNRRLTRCADGTRKEECYVASIDFKEVGIDPLTAIEFSAYNEPLPLLLRAKIQARNYDGFGNLGILVIKSAFKAFGDYMTNNLYAGLEDNGIRCITSPCFSTDEYILNRKRIRTISNIDLRNVNASQWDMDAAWKVLADGGVLLAAGKNSKTDELTGTGVSFIANQFFLPLTGQTK